MINYNVDDFGTLKVYYDNYILFEISECKKLSEKEIIKLIIEELE